MLKLNMQKAVLILFLLINLTYVAVGLHKKAETRSKVVIVDTGANIPFNVKALCNDVNKNGLRDNNGHGTMLFNIIKTNLSKKACIYPINAYQQGVMNEEFIISAIYKAIKMKAKVINLSFEGIGESVEERIAVKDAINHGIYVVIASGNKGIKLTKENCNTYPACYDLKSDKFVVVGANNFKGNTGYLVDVYTYGEYNGVFGTSFSTARWSKVLINTISNRRK